MKLYLNREAHFMRLTTLLRSPQMLAELHTDTPVPDTVVQWLGRLKLLHGLPFNYLVPDEAMLPNESIRFFQVDQEWIDFLVEGAFSLGRSNSSDRAHDMVFRQRVHAGAEGAARSLRASRMKQDDTDAAAAITGFFLRSSVVSGWPGLEAVAYDAAGVALPVRRMERVAPSILLSMVEGVIDHVDVSEPPEGLHFGVDLAAGAALRYVTVPAGAPPGKHPGSTIDGVASGAVPLRSNGVIKVNRLATTIGDTLASIGANNEAGSGKRLPFTSAEFAMEMVERVRTVRIVNKS